MTTKVLAIDPYDCGCTECLVGEYVPLRAATAMQIAALLRGELGNNTGSYNTFKVDVRYEVAEDETLAGVMPSEVKVTFDEQEWTLEPWALGLRPSRL
jgi:hypothetical protein